MNEIDAINGLSVATANNDTERADEKSKNSWYMAMTKAWGNSLDRQAGTIETMSEGLNNGQDKPSDLILLTAEAQKMGFLTNSASSAVNSVGKAAETLARKQ